MDSRAQPPMDPTRDMTKERAKEFKDLVHRKTEHDMQRMKALQEGKLEHTEAEKKVLAICQAQAIKQGLPYGAVAALFSSFGLKQFIQNKYIRGVTVLGTFGWTTMVAGFVKTQRSCIDLLNQVDTSPVAIELREFMAIERQLKAEREGRPLTNDDDVRFARKQFEGRNDMIRTGPLSPTVDEVESSSDFQPDRNNWISSSSSSSLSSASSAASANTYPESRSDSYSDNTNNDRDRDHERDRDEWSGDGDDDKKRSFDDENNSNTNRNHYSNDNTNTNVNHNTNTNTNTTTDEEEIYWKPHTPRQSSFVDEDERSTTQPKKKLSYADLREQHRAQ